MCKKEWQNLLHEVKIEEGSDEVNPTSSSGSSTSVPAKRKRLSK